MQKPQLFKSTFLKKRKIKENITSFYFKKDSKFKFLAGQYIKMTLPLVSPDARGSSRFFTIACSPLIPDFFVITTKKGPSSFKIKLFNLKEGEKVDFYGPLGPFDIESTREYVFLAGGMGINPFYSMITYANQKKLKQKLTLIASFNIRKNFLYFEELKEIEEQNKNIKVIYLSERISETLISKYIEKGSSAKFLVAGPPQMVNKMYEVILGMKVNAENIISENFSGY